MAVVYWGYPDGSAVASCPLPRESAEAMAEAYQRAFPGRRAWIETPPALR